jgi:chromosomal replication initiation ATPase DnaA
MVNSRKTIIDHTISRVTAATRVILEEIRAKNRHVAIVYARNILCHELAEQRFRNGEIGEVIHRDRSTIYNCIQMYRNDYSTDETFRMLAKKSKE